MRSISILTMTVCCLVGIGALSPIWGQECLGELKSINQPEMMALDGERLYVLDGIQVSIFSMPKLNLLKVFGTEGAGPGEFQVNFMNRLRLQLTADGLVLSDFNKVAFFTRDGQFVREIRLPFGASQVIPLDDGLVVTRFMNGENGANQMAVVLLDAKLQEKKILYTKPEIDVQRSRRLDAPNEMIFLMADQQIYVTDEAKFQVLVFDKQGHELRRISLDSKPVKLNEQYKSEVLQWFEDSWEGRFKTYARANNLTKEMMRDMIYFHDFFPAFRSVSLTEQGFCFETYHKNGQKSKFMLMDRQGKIHREFYLCDAEPGRVKMFPAVSFAFNAGYYYYVQEDLVSETWSLYREKY